MPPVVIGAVAAGGLAAATGTVIFGLTVLQSAFVIAGLNLAFGLVTQALGKKESSFSVEARDRTVTVRGSAVPRSLAFGETSVGGSLALFEPTGASNEFLHVVEAHADHPCDAIVDWYVNNELVGHRDAAGNVTDGRFAGHLRLRPLLGAFDQAADSALVAEVSTWTDEHKGGGVCATVSRLTWSADVWPNGFTGLRARLRGMPLYDPRDTGATIVSSSTGGPAAVFATDAAHGFAVGQHVWIKGHLGAIITGPAGTERFTGKWHQVASVPGASSFTAIDEDGNPVAFTTGGTGGTATAMAWSDNWALCVRAYLTHRWTFNAQDDEVDDAALIVAANICDEQVALTPEPVSAVVLSTIATADVDNDALVLADHMPFQTGDPVRVAATGSPPSPLVAGTVYYAIPDVELQQQVTTFEGGQAVDDGRDFIAHNLPRQTVITTGLGLATSEANAEAGTAIALTDAGSGTISLIDAGDRVFLESNPGWKTGDLVNFTSTDTLPSGGAVARDATANGNDGTLVGGATRVAPKLGTAALQIAVSGDRVDIADNAVYSGLTDATQEFWLRITAIGTATSFRQVVGKDVGVSDRMFKFFLKSNADLDLQWSWGDGTVNFDQTVGTLTLNQWHHVALVKTGDDFEVFLDGVSTNTRTITNATIGNAEDLRILQSNGSSFEIDDHRIWNITRTQTEIADNKDAPLTGNEPGLVGYWRFDDGLLAGPDYYAIRQRESFYQFAATLEDARARNAVDIADAGAGDHTATRVSQPRYTCNGVASVAGDPFRALESMMTAAAGVVTYEAGLLKVFAGAATTATGGAVTVSDMRDGDLNVEPFLPRAQVFNAARGTFVDPDAFYTEADLPPYLNETYRLEDDGERIFRDFDFPFTDDRTRGQRLLKIAVERARQGVTCVFPAKPRKFATGVWDVEALTIDDFGWAGKEFRVMGRSEGADFGVDVIYREEAAAVWDWNLGDETTIDLAPNSNLPSAGNVLPPEALDMQEELYRTRQGGGIKSRAVLTWDPSPDAFVQSGGDYQVEYRQTGEPAYKVQAPVRVPRAEIDDLEPAVYEFRVQARNVFRAPSRYVTLAKEIFGLPGPPQDLSGLTLYAAGGTAGLRWDRHPDLDVREGGQIRFRHSPLVSGATWQGSTSIGDPVDGFQTGVSFPLKPGTYLARVFDAGNTPSPGVASVSTKQAALVAFATLDTVIEHPLFLGTHSGTAGVDGVLKLSGTTLIDDWADFDAVADFDIEGGIATTGTYGFSAGIDLGSVKRARLTAQLKALVVNALDAIDERSGLIDDWEDFDGVETGSADAIVEVRLTDDDPAGSPSWGAWQRLDAAEVEARGIDPRVLLSTSDAAYNIEVSELTLTAEEVA